MHSLSLRHLSLRDYRCFDALEVDFHERLTVLVAANGAGKTSVLDAVAVALGPYVGAFDEGVGRHFEADDIRQRRVRETGSNEMEHAPQGVWLQAKGQIPGSLDDDLMSRLSTWQRRLAGPSKTKTTIREAKELIAYGKQLQMSVRTPGEPVVLPLLAYYYRAPLATEEAHRRQAAARSAWSPTWPSARPSSTLNLALARPAKHRASC